MYSLPHRRQRNRLRGELVTTTSTPSMRIPGRRCGATRPETMCDSSPTVANGIVYVGSDDHNVYALDANTGTKMWNYTTGSIVDSSPAVSNGIVYVGELGSTTSTPSMPLPGRRCGATRPELRVFLPAVANGIVYVGSDDHNVYALNANTGAKMWNYTTGGPLTPPPRCQTESST